MKPSKRAKILESDLPLPSRKHASLELDETRLVFLDLSGWEGTPLNTMIMYRAKESPHRVPIWKITSEPEECLKQAKAAMEDKGILSTSKMSEVEERSYQDRLLEFSTKISEELSRIYQTSPSYISEQPGYDSEHILHIKFEDS